MELREFIAQTLQQIIRGVHDAKRSVGPARIAPVIRPTADDANTLRVVGGEAAQFVDFDVAVTVTETNASGAEAGISVVSFGKVGGDVKRSNENQSVSRIRFKVPILY